MVTSDPWASPEPEPRLEHDDGTVQGLLALLKVQLGLLVAVSTGGPRIEDVNAEYQDRRLRLNAGLRRHGIAPPFPWDDLWAWYGEWSTELPTYKERRLRIGELGRPAREALETALQGVQVSDPGGAGSPPTWWSLDERVDGVVAELRDAQSRDDLQDVGRRCREILIDAAKLLADPALVPPDREPPKAADAKAWLDLFLASRASGRSHRELRAFIPPAWDLAQKVTHGDVDRVDAYAAAQATVLIVRSLQQLASADQRTQG